MTSLAHSHASYDAIVIGARCAGAATAMLLARRGLRLLVADRAAYGSDTLSTNALMRGGVLQLSRWGLLEEIIAARTPPVRRVTFHYDDESLEVPIANRDGVGALFAPRRTVLDKALADAARAAGADLLYGVRLVDLVRDAQGRVTGAVIEDRHEGARSIRADVVIGADGIRSTVAGLVGSETTHRGSNAGWVVFGYWRGLPVDGYHWHYRLGVSAGVIPTNDGQTLVFAAAPPWRFRSSGTGVDTAGGYRRVIEAVAPELAERFEQAELVGPLHGFAGEQGFLRRCWGPGWALVGDAGYFRDPITAHGITDALRDAELLARAVVDGSPRALADYEATRNDLVMDLFQVTDEIASYTWDMARVRDLHRALSRAMNQEVRMLNALGDWPARGGQALPTAAVAAPPAGVPALEAS
jgi:menaquinone-9 beta-reductase